MTESNEQKVDFTALLGSAGEHIARALEGLVGPASPATIFSEPRVVGDDLVFTAAAWERGGGFGFGAGQGDDGTGGRGGGSGGGGGGGAQGRPVAVIKVGPSGVDVRPVIDFTKVGVTILLSGLGVWSAMRRRR